MVGLWDARRNYARIGEVTSGGVGPHDIRLLSDGRTLVVANGGIETHPETGRAKLNLPVMQSNLSYLGLDGELRVQVHLEAAHQRNSIRHLAVSAQGDVAFAMQWQGDLGADVPLLGVHTRQTNRVELAEAASVRRMQGYLGRVAIDATGRRVAVTSPRVGVLQRFVGTSLDTHTTIEDVCGVAAVLDRFVVTSSTGLVRTGRGTALSQDVALDNHLIAI